MQEYPEHIAGAILSKPGYSCMDISCANIDMSLNTNSRGCSPTVVRALQETFALSSYPHPDGLPLREQVAAQYGIPTESVVLGAGADELIYTIVGSLYQLGHRQLVTTEFIFPNIVHAANLIGLRLISAPYTPGKYVDCISRAVDLAKRSRVPLFMCNPSAPFGEVIPWGTITDMIGKLNVPSSSTRQQSTSARKNRRS